MAELDGLAETAERTSASGARLLFDDLVDLRAAPREVRVDPRGEERPRQHEVDCDAESLARSGMIALTSPAMPGRVPFDRSMHPTGCFTDSTGSRRCGPISAAHVGRHLADEADEVQRHDLEGLPPVLVGEVGEGAGAGPPEL